MIDIEDDVIDILTEELENACPGITVASDESRVPEEFPFVCIHQIDDYTFTETRDSSNPENHIVSTFEVTIYSNASVGKKTECKRIFKIIDDRFLNWNFSRISKAYTTRNNGTQGFMAARYQAVVSQNKTIYRR